jgi:uncharacterized protein YodC (DUF2158 family)
MLKVGDVVKFNSGSLTMTIVEVLNEEYVKAAWFYEGGFKSDNFPIDCLMKL